MATRDEMQRLLNFYWLALPAGQAKVGQLVVASRDGQHFDIEKADNVETITILLSDQMVDLDKPVVITANGKELFKGIVARKVSALASTLAQRGDPYLVFPAEVSVKL